MNFLENFIKKSKRSQALVYAFALLLFIAVFTIWSSFKAEQTLLSFLPSTTSFYYQWQTEENNQAPIVNFLQNNLQQSAKAELDILGSDFLGKTRELIWFKIADSETNYYFIKSKNSFNKKELKELFNNKSFSWYLVEKNILAIASQPDLKLDFVSQGNPGIDPHFFNPSGENIFFVAKNLSF